MPQPARPSLPASIPASSPPGESTKPPLKPILRQPLKPCAAKNPLKTPLPPSPPPKTRQGDPLWLRVMQTKENQWRLINTLALHELNLLETSACTQLDSLADTLDSLITKTHQLDALVRRCRALRAQQRFLNIASSPLRHAVRLLLSLPYADVTHLLLQSASTLEIPAPAIDKELIRFRQAAVRFADAAHGEGLDDLVAIAALLQNVVNLAAKEPDSVSCAAQAVADAATLVERRRLDVVEHVVDAANTGFVAEPSFIE